MKKKHKKKLINLIVSMIVMLVVTGVGYFQSTFEEEAKGQALAKPRNARGIFQLTRNSRI